MVKRFLRNWAILALFFALAGFGAHVFTVNFDLFLATLVIVVVLGGVFAVPVTLSERSEGGGVAGTSLKRVSLLELMKRLPDAPPEECGGDWGIWYRNWGLEDYAARLLNQSKTGWTPKEFIQAMLSRNSAWVFKNHPKPYRFGKKANEQVIRWLEKNYKALIAEYK